MSTGARWTGLLRIGMLALACGCELSALGCSAPPPPPVRRAPPPTPTVTASAVASAQPAPPALWIEGEGLSPVVGVAFSKDGAVLFVKRKDDAIEAWDAVKGTPLERATAAEIQAGRMAGNPFSAPPPPAPMPPPAGPARLFLEHMDGVDEKPLVAWARKIGLQVTFSERGVELAATGTEQLETSPDGRIVVVTKDGVVDIAHRVAHTHTSVGGWNRSYSSHYGFDDNTTWPGEVNVRFGPLPEQVALQSIATHSLYYAHGEVRLFDARKGKVTAQLGEQTCQPNDLVWSPLGKLLVRQTCMESVLLFNDAVTGATLPSQPGDLPVSFAPGDAVLAAAYDGTARIFGVTDAAPRVVVPGPLLVSKVGLAADGASLSLLRGDGLDMWDLTGGRPVVHVEGVPPATSEPVLALSGTGRFHGFHDSRIGALVVLDTKTGSTRREPPGGAFHPTRDLLVRGDDKGVAVVDLVTGEPRSKPVAVNPRKARPQRVGFSTDGAWAFALLTDASVLVLDDTGHLHARVPPMDREGCAGEPERMKADRVRFSCQQGAHVIALATGKDGPDDDGSAGASWTGCKPLPPFAPRALVEACKTAESYHSPPWSATGTLLIAGLTPPLLTRAKDGKSLSIHSFAYGTGRAAIVVDESGRWDANDLGASLVHVSVGAVDDPAEKARRRTPGLLAAFTRGD